MQRHAPITYKTTSFARTYPGKPDQVRRMRADLKAFLDGCPAIDDLVLVADEFCANAVTHTRSGQPGGSFDVRVHAAIDDHVRVEVRDNGGRWLDPGHDDRPHGLAIVAAVAGDGNWGVDGDELTGRVVWARLDWTHQRDATLQRSPRWTGLSACSQARKEQDMDDPRRYMQMLDYIGRRIEDGTFKPGKLMPNINALSSQTGYSRHTISKALRLLQDEGLVERTPGLGYIVCRSGND